MGAARTFSHVDDLLDADTLARRLGRIGDPLVITLGADQGLTNFSQTGAQSVQIVSSTDLATGDTGTELWLTGTANLSALDLSYNDVTSLSALPGGLVSLSIGVYGDNSTPAVVVRDALANLDDNRQLNGSVVITFDSSNDAQVTAEINALADRLQAKGWYVVLQS